MHLHRYQEEEKKFSQIVYRVIRCSAQRLLKSCSIEWKNSVEWKVKWKEETFHAFSIHNLSQKVLLSSHIFVFIDQLEICKDYYFSFFACMLGDLRWRKCLGGMGFGTSWNCCKMKILMVLSHSVKYTYLEIFGIILHFRRCEKSKPNQPENVICWRSFSFQEAADHPATFTKINIPSQLSFLFYNSSNGSKL